MRHRDPNMHWISERCIPNFMHGAEKRKKYSLEVKKSLLDCFVLSIFIYCNEYWTISPRMWRKLEAAEMVFYTESHAEILMNGTSKQLGNLYEIATERTSILKNRKRTLKLIGYITRKEMENLNLTHHTEGKKR